MNGRELAAHLRSLDGGWVDWNDTVDRFVAGDPERELTGIAVGWMSFEWALRQALELGCNLFVTHEPTFFSGHDDDASMFRFETARAKRAWIEQSGIAILRCHDIWDQLPNIGIPDSWARQLGFEQPAGGEGYVRVFDVSGRTALSVAQQVASRTKELGQPAVELLGDGDTPVSRVAIGTGAISPFTRYVHDHGADLAICSDDGFTYWREGALAAEMGVPVIVVNHAVSEVFGIRLLAEHLDERFPDVPVHHIPQRCMFQLVMPE